MAGFRNGVAAAFGGAMLFAAMSAHAVSVNWASLTSDDPNAGTVTGTVQTSSGPVTAVYSGGDLFDQLNNTGTNYWSPPDFTQGVVNPPLTSDIIALSDANTGTLTFSAPVTNVFMAFNSYNGAEVTFSSPFKIISQGCAYWGCGTFVPNANNTGFYGNSETVGVLEFLGTFTSISFTDTVTEDWHGFTFGVSPAPEAPTWVAMLLGFGLAGAGLRMARRKARLSLSEA